MDEELKYLLTVLMIGQMRLYDVLLMQYAESTDEERAFELRSLHEKGKYMCPPPFLAPDDDE